VQELIGWRTADRYRWSDVRELKTIVDQFEATAVKPYRTFTIRVVEGDDLFSHRARSGAIINDPDDPQLKVAVYLILYGDNQCALRNARGVAAGRTKHLLYRARLM